MPAKGTRKKKEVKPVEELLPKDPEVLQQFPDSPAPTGKTVDDYLAIARATEGWISEAEMDLLFRTAIERANSAEENVWVEDGSFHGKSSVLLAGALALFGEGKLYCVDPHTGNLSFPTHYEDGLLASDRLDNVGPTIEAFRATIEQAEVGQFVQEVITGFQNFAVDHGVLTLAFLDGLHDVDSVRADWAHLKPMLHDQAIVMFHDIGVWFGPTQVFSDAINAGELIEIARADSLAVARYAKRGI